MNRIFALFAALALAAPAPATAQDIPAVVLVPGEAVTVRLDDGGRARPLERGKAQWSDLDIYAAQHLAGITPPDAPVPVATPLFSAPEPERIPPGAIRMRLHSIAGKHTLLVVENGLQRAFAYRARITTEGETRQTDVCVVSPGFPMYEHWPHPIERIELSNFRHVQWQPGQPPTCE